MLSQHVLICIIKNCIIKNWIILRNGVVLSLGINVSFRGYSRAFAYIMVCLVGDDDTFEWLRLTRNVNTIGG